LAVFGDYVAQQVLAVEIKAVAEPAGEFVATTDLDEKPLRIALSRR
jgi:isoleucyl-tRNA synthetase